MNAKKLSPAIARSPAALLLLGAASLPQAAPDAPTEKLLARVDEARGRSTKPLDTLSAAGTFELRIDEAGSAPIATGTFLETWAGRAAFRNTTSMDGLRDQERGMADGVVWEIEPNAGASVHAGAKAAALQRYAAILRGAPASELHRSIASDGTRDLDGAPHVVLKMTPPKGDGGADTWWIEPTSARVARIDLKLPTTQDCILVFGFPEWSEAHVRFGDWKRIDGAEFPCRRVVRMGSMEVTMAATKVERGVTLEPARMQLPEVVVKAAARRAPDADSPYEILERPAQPTATVRIQCKASEYYSKIATIFPEVIGLVTERGAKMAGVPFTLFHSIDGDWCDIEAGIPIVKAIEGKGRVKPSELPGGRTLMTWQSGPYDQLREAHERLLRHADEEELTPRGGSWETYWTDAGMVTDPAKWKTQIFLPIE